MGLEGVHKNIISKTIKVQNSGVSGCLGFSLPQFKSNDYTNCHWSITSQQLGAVTMILNTNDIFESSARLVTLEPYQSWQDLVMARVRPSQIKTPELYSSASRHRVVAIALAFVLHASLEQALGSNPIEIISLLARSKSSVAFIATAISISRPGSLQWTSSPLLLVLLLPSSSRQCRRIVLLLAFLCCCCHQVVVNAGGSCYC